MRRRQIEEVLVQIDVALKEKDLFLAMAFLKAARFMVDFYEQQHKAKLE